MPTLNYDTRNGLCKLQHGIRELHQTYLKEERDLSGTAKQTDLVTARQSTDDMFEYILAAIEELLKDEPTARPLAPYWTGNGFYSEEKPDCGTERD